MVPQEFQPTLNEQTVQNYINLYKQQPERMSSEELDLLSQHADYYRIPFAVSEGEQQGRVSGILNQVGSGFLSGFSTFHVGKEPKDEWEGIARNVGHLAGFVGYVPSLPFKILGLRKLANAARFLKGKSIPMVIATAAEKKVSKIAGNVLGKSVSARAGATGAALGFLQKPVVKDILSGSFHLGVASSVGAWQGGIDEMMRAFIGGAETGAVFRGIGNIVNTGSAAGDKVLRGLSSSLYTGLPATARGATTPEQVYEYLLGAYFGVKEMPYHRRQGLKHIAGMNKERTRDPETVEGWEKLDDTTQKFVKEESRKIFGTDEEVSALAFKLAEDYGVSVERATELAESYLKKRPKYTSYGEEISPLAVKEKGEVELLIGEERREEPTISQESDNTDRGTPVDNLLFTKKTQAFVERSLEKEWRDTDDSLSSLANTSYDVEAKWYELTKEARETTKENPSQGMVDWIQKKYKVNLDEEGRNFWRQWGERRVKGERVPLLTAKDGVLRPIIKGNDMNDAGNTKILIEEPKLVDDVFNKAEERRTGAPLETKEKSYTILDHAVMSTNRGFEEVDLLDIERVFYKEEFEKVRGEYPKKEAREIASNAAGRRTEEFHANNFIEMDKKDYYYYGGKGDANRQYFVRYHPETADLNKQIAGIRRIFKATGVSPQAFKKAFNESMEEWTSKMNQGDISKEEAERMFKKAYVSNVLYELEMNGFSTDFVNLNKTLTEGFINSAKAFNKRQQIWFTSGYSSSPEFIKGKIKDVTPDGKFKAVVIKDEAHELWSDGAIHGRSDVIDAQNADWGLPTEGGNSKSFIVSPNAEKGALLGKYMVHTASDPLQELMTREGIHFIIPESSAKQYGLHKLGKLKWVNGRPRLSGDITEISIKDFKGVLSERTDKHSIDNQRVPKQMLSNLTPYSYSDIKPEVIDDMYQTLSGKSFAGEEEWNSVLSQYLVDPKANKTLLPSIIKNLDRVGIAEVLNGIKQPNATAFANAAYAKIQRINSDILSEMVAEGEMTDAELKDSSLEAGEQIMVHERLMRHSSDSLAGVLHKFSRDYRLTSIRNYVVNRLTRPILGNSFTTRMRPYEVGLQYRKDKYGNTSLLKTKGGKNLFFLDDGFKEMKLQSEHWKGTRTLWEVWKEYADGGFKGIRPQIKEMLRGIIMRVPMDSPSGAHVLNFGGFTGIRGYGSLLHEKTMEALGGADLDGDKAFGFFGSEEFGFKKSWKEMYHAQKNEYREESTDDVKAAFRGNFTFSPTEKLTKVQQAKKDKIDKVLQYSPQSRRNMSDASADGRGRLGPAVVNKATISAAYAAARASKRGHYEYEVNLGTEEDPKFRIIRMTPKKDKDSMREFGRKGRASVGFASDPMDESGLKDYNVFYNEMVDSAFKWEFFEPLAKGKRRYMVKESLQANKKGWWVSAKRQGLTGVLGGLNSALYGRNLSEGRRYSFDEIKSRIERVFDPFDGIPKESRNTLLPKLAEDLREIDWSDNIFGRLLRDKDGRAAHLIELYKKHNQNLGSFKWLRDILGRKTMAVPRGAYIDLVLNHNLHTETGIVNLLNPKIKDPLAGKEFKEYNKRDEYDSTNMEQREGYLRDILRKAEDFIVNDISDVVSMNRIMDTAEGLEEVVVRDIANKAENLKRSSYLMARRRGEVLDINKKDLTPEDREFIEYMDTITQESPFSSLSDQAEINNSISRMKSQMNQQEADLLDSFLLGTVSRGQHEALVKLEKGYEEAKRRGNIREFWKVKNKMEKIRKFADNTTISRLGFASKSVSESSVRKYMDNFKELFDYATSIPSEKIQSEVKKEAQIADRKQPLVDEEGNRVKGSFFESADYDESTQKYLDEYAPFVGLEKGKLSGAAESVYSELKENLDYYHNGIGKNLNGLIRSLLGKDLNAMNLEDFRILNRWFKEVRTGTWYQKFFNQVKDKSPKLSKWHYMMFPEAINRDLLRYEMKLMDERRPYKDKFGNIISGKAMKPVSVMEELQTWIHAGQEQSIQAFEEEKKLLQDSLSPYLKGVEDGDLLHEMAIRIRERQIIGRVLKPKFGTKGMFKHYARQYEDAYRESAKGTDWKNIRNKTYAITTKDGVRKMTGEEVVEKINEFYTKQNDKVHKWLTGEEGRVDKYLDLDDGTLGGLTRLRETFLNDMREAARKGERFDVGIGIDGMRRVAKRIMMSQIPKAYREELPAMRKNIELEKTGKYDPDIYFPHMMFDKKIAGKALDQALDIILKDGTMSKEDKVKEVKKLAFHHKQLTGDWIPTDEMGKSWEHVDMALEEIAEGKRKSEEGITWFHSNQKVGNQFSRAAHIGGWNIDPSVYENYMKNILDTYYRLGSQIAARTTIIDFRYDHLKRFSNPEMTNSWANFFNLYAQQSMGYPSKIPERVLNNPEMHIKGTPYSWFADSKVLGKLNKMRKKLGIKEDERLPEELQGFDYNQLASWGNLEAKYELASLLAHPKSSIANLYGGTVHTLVSTGYSNFKNARSLGFLKTHVNPKWESMSDVEDWVKSHGVIEEFLMYEADINPKLKTNKWKRFMKDATAKISKDPDMEDKSLMQLAKKYGITESIFDKAAWFMRRPERTLRRDAFVAHYLQAKEKFGGAIADYNHPYLISLAKKGVKGTQFLYSAPFRPMFAATTLGKVMTRFQLWAWNSSRFRNNVLRDAQIYGWREGTQEFERFKRLATADLMMLSLGSVFMYSLFENALPAPWNWFQDLSDLMFGEDKERERAFFGAYPYPLQPLQMVTPPVLRLLPPIFKGIVQDDYSKLSNYYIWTMFPFGRFARDIIHPKSGLLVNPTRGIEKLTGLPYMQFAKQKKEEKEKTKLKPRGLL